MAHKLSQFRINNIRAQGYITQTDEQIQQLAFGNRFAYQLCVSIVAVGVIIANSYILGAMAMIAFFGVVLPNHPFDYIYNHLIRQRMHLPKLPARSMQLKFACSLATTFLMATVACFNMGYAVAGYVLGSALIIVATLVSTIDYCIPSVIYNYMFLKNKPETINQ